MSLGLPSHLARVTLSVALRKALHAVALAALLCAGLIVIAFMVDGSGLALWPALISVISMVVALHLNDRFDSPLFNVTYLLVGAAGVYWYSLTLAALLPEAMREDSLWLVLPKVALVMVAGVGVSAWAAVGWCVLGFAVAEVFAGLAIAPTGFTAEFDFFTLSAMLVAIAVIALSVFARSRARKAQPQLHRAAREERMSAVRSGMELKAAALLHDTVLSHLAAIANAPGTELAPQLTEQIRRDLELIVGEEWLRDVEPATTATTTDWRKSPLLTAIHESKLQGLEIIGNGDMAAVARLARVQSNALGLAVKQCLTNVIKHSGVMTAELAVYGSDTEVSVMVVDSGSGFDLNAVGADRLGLKASVRRRIENAGGIVQLWSTPGSGTSVLIRVPVAATEWRQAEPELEQAGEPG